MFKKYLGFISAILFSVLIFIFRDIFINFKEFGIIGLFIVSILGNATIILPVPVVVTAFIGGSVYNPIVVSVTVALGATIGEMTGYWAGASGKGIVENNKKIQKVKIWMDKYGLWTIFLLSAVPNPLFDLAGIVAGGSGISIKKYFLIVFFGKIIKFGLLAYAGNFMIK